MCGFSFGVGGLVGWKIISNGLGGTWVLMFEIFVGIYFLLVVVIGFQCVLGCINSQYFHIIGEGHQPNSKRLYSHLCLN